jgi:ABC-type Fe3+/spermidine/putrescine transport system ATPase subunit
VQGLTVSGISKSFGEIRALDDISFAVNPGEIVAVLGPSGCGKSTLLAIIAGLEIPNAGDVRWDGEILKGVPPHLRGFGLMFQDYALFPHRNVTENVAFGLQMAGLDINNVRSRVSAALNLVGLSGLETRDVNSLSGGEQQRVALARSLAPEPQLLMLDEPLGSLDRTLRERLLLELKDILRHLHQTAIYVTHDQEEAFAIADRVVVMNIGTVAQIGTPQEIYSHPASIFVARFLGLDNLFTCHLREIDGRFLVETPIGDLPVHAESPSPVIVLIRPDAARLDDHGELEREGRLIETSFRGNTCRAVIEINGSLLTFEFLSTEPLPAIGERVQLSFNPAQAIQILQ